LERSKCKNSSGIFLTILFSGGKADILEQNGMAYENLVQPDVIVMQYAFNKPSQETQVPQSFQEVTSEFRSNFLDGQFSF
jgi:hypothetical protein